MENASYIGLSKQMAMRSKMDMTSNNLANMSTPGFMGQNMLFKEYISEPRDAQDPITMVQRIGQYNTVDKGPIKQTGNPLDLALQGPGFFGVQTQGGGTAYTRAGNFTLNAEGTLVTSDGRQVQSAGGGPVVIPPDAKNIFVTETGAISTDQGGIGQIMVQEFDNLQSLKPAGNGLYETDEEGIPAEGTQVLQGALEGSNVNPINEVTKMIDILRTYQSTQRMLSDEHERQRTMIRRLSEQG